MAKEFKTQEAETVMVAKDYTIYVNLLETITIKNMFGFIVRAAGRVVEGAIERAIGDAVYDICAEVFYKNVILLEIYVDDKIDRALNAINEKVDNAIEEEHKKVDQPC